MELSWKQKLISLGRGMRRSICLEVVLVVSILGVVTSVAAPRYDQALQKVGMVEAVARLNSIMTASKYYYYKTSGWPKSPDAVGYYADFSATEHFTYRILTDQDLEEGFVLQAKGIEASGSEDMTIVMSCADVSAENIIQMQHRSLQTLIQ